MNIMTIVVTMELTVSYSIAACLFLDSKQCM